MKNIYILAFLCCFFLVSNAQTKEHYIFSADIKFDMISGLGNKYFKDSFKTSPGFSIGLNFNFKKNYGVFFELKNHFLEIKNPEIYGNFTKISCLNYNFGGKYVYFYNDKLNFEGKLFVGGFNLDGKVTGNNSSYKQDGTAFGTGINAIFSIDEKGSINLIGGIDLKRFISKIYIENSFYQDYYNKSTIIEPNLGIRFNF